ncbi:MAG TPA: hypothetical protein VM925_03870 [Labilithrix sp.]|nr:hypothetical protein [Labilithrix sp.]
MSGFVACAVSAGLAVACGGDDDAANNASPDPGTPDGATPTQDGNTADSTTDAAVDAPATSLVPKTSLELPNAIDPYGLVYGSDGFLYASGSTLDGADQKLAVWRFKDGALDATFGTGGVVTVDVPGNELSFDIVEVSAGNFVVHAVAGGKIYLVKLTKEAGGNFVFGTPKFVKFGFDEGEGWPVGTPNPPAADPAYASWGIGVDRSVANTPKIVVFAFGAPAKPLVAANQRTLDDRWITRVLADTLEIDPAFNGGAPWSVDADGKDKRDQGRRGIVLDDGSIISSGYTDFGSKNNVVLIRLKPDGTADTTFGFGIEDAGASPGQTKFNPFSASGGFAEAYGVVRQSTGRLVTTGYGTSNFDTPSIAVDLVSFGVNPDGIDPTYGKLGSFVVQSETNPSAGQNDAGIVPWDDRGRDIAVLPDDRIVHAGLYDFAASIFVTSKDGKLESTSGDGGTLAYPWRQSFFKVAVSPDGKAIAATAKSLRPGGDASAPLGSLLVTLAVGQ